MREQSSERYSLKAAAEAYRLAKLVEGAKLHLERQQAMSAILARLEEARREHVASYLADRIKRETSQDLS